MCAGYVRNLANSPLGRQARRLSAEFFRVGYQFFDSEEEEESVEGIVFGVNRTLKFERDDSFVDEQTESTDESSEDLEDVAEMAQPPAAIDLQAFNFDDALNDVGEAGVDLDTMVDTACCSQTRATEIWRELFRLMGGQFQAGEIRSVQRQVLQFLINNGSSGDGLQFGEVKLQRGDVVKSWSMSLLVQACEPDTVRKFARANADTMMKMVTNSPPGWMSKWGKQRGMTLQDRTVSFDVADYCHGLTQRQQIALANAKSRVLAGTEPLSPTESGSVRPISLNRD